MRLRSRVTMRSSAASEFSVVPNDPEAFMCVKIACTFVGDVTVIPRQKFDLDGDKYNQLFDADEIRRWALNS